MELKAKPYDVVQGTKYIKDGEEKTRWQKMGVAFEKEGKITSVKLEALPIPNKDGEIWLNIFEQKPREVNGMPVNNSNPSEDEVPFQMARVTPKIGRFGGIGDIQKRLKGSRLIYDNRDELALAMLQMASTNITDIIEWDGDEVRIKGITEIPETALNAIKKIKMTPTKNGNQIEVELYDKVRLMQLLAKSAGLLDEEREVDKPAVVSIEMVMPKEEKQES